MLGLDRVLVYVDLICILDSLNFLYWFTSLYMLDSLNFLCLCYFYALKRFRLVINNQLLGFSVSDELMV